MLTNEEFKRVVEHLTDEKLSLRVAALDDLWQYPSADARILPILRRLLYDKTPCLLAIPYRFGEIRWLAAHALAAERAAQAIMKPVRLPNVVPPLDTAGVVSHEDKAGINGNMNWPESFTSNSKSEPRWLARWFFSSAIILMAYNAQQAPSR